MHAVDHRVEEYVSQCHSSEPMLDLCFPLRSQGRNVTRQHSPLAGASDVLLYMPMHHVIRRTGSVSGRDPADLHAATHTRTQEAHALPPLSARLSTSNPEFGAMCMVQEELKKEKLTHLISHPPLSSQAPASAEAAAA